MILTCYDKQCIKEQMEETRLKLYELLDDPKKSPLDLDVLKLSEQLDELIVIYLKQI